MFLCKQELAKSIDKGVLAGTQGGPLMHIIAPKAVALKEAMMPSFAEYQKQIVKNAQTMAARLMSRDFELVSGGTDNHLMLIDLRNKGITGKAAEQALDEVGITVNKNAVPYDSEKPAITSGMRIGTPAVTTRGMREEEMVAIADMIADIVESPESELVREQVRARVRELCSRFGLYA